MANKFRIYDKAGNVILDNASSPINIPIVPGTAYATGDFKWALLDTVGNETQTGNVAAFTATQA